MDNTEPSLFPQEGVTTRRKPYSASAGEVGGTQTG